LQDKELLHSIPLLSDLDYNFFVHELSITESILNTAIKYAQKEKAHKVTDLEITQVGMNWFRFAADRDGGRRRKDRRNNEKNE